MPITADLEVQEAEVTSAFLAELDIFPPPGPDEVVPAVAHALARLEEIVRAEQLTIAGPPRAIYRSRSEHAVACAVAIPVLQAPARGASHAGFTIHLAPAARTIRFAHHGPHRRLSETYGLIDEWLFTHGGITTGEDWECYYPVVEIYVSDPATTPESEFVTDIHLSLP